VNDNYHSIYIWLQIISDNIKKSSIISIKNEISDIYAFALWHIWQQLIITNDSSKYINWKNLLLLLLLFKLNIFIIFIQYV